MARKIKGVVLDFEKTVKEKDALIAKENTQTTTSQDIIEKNEKEFLSFEDKQVYKEKIDAALEIMAENDVVDALRLIDKMISEFSTNPSIIETMSRLYQSTTNIPTEDKKATLDAITETINQRFETNNSRNAL